MQTTLDPHAAWRRCHVRQMLPAIRQEHEEAQHDGLVDAFFLMADALPGMGRELLEQLADRDSLKASIDEHQSGSPLWTIGAHELADFADPAFDSIRGQIDAALRKPPAPGVVPVLVVGATNVGFCIVDLELD